MKNILFGMIILRAQLLMNAKSNFIWYEIFISLIKFPINYSGFSFSFGLIIYLVGTTITIM